MRRRLGGGVRFKTPPKQQASAYRSVMCNELCRNRQGMTAAAGQRPRKQSEPTTEKHVKREEVPKEAWRRMACTGFQRIANGLIPGKTKKRPRNFAAKKNAYFCRTNAWPIGAKKSMHDPKQWHFLSDNKYKILKIYSLSISLSARYRTVHVFLESLDRPDEYAQGLD